MVGSISGSGRKKIHEQEYYMDGYLMDNFLLVKDLVKKDWDMICLYDGYEGSGKSVKAMQDAYYFDPTFNLDRVCFTTEEFVKAVDKAEKYTAVLFDEAYTGMSSRDTMKSVNKMLDKRITEIRQKNLYVFIVMPTFFDLAKRMAIWRSKYLIHVYTSKNVRGFFAFYNQDRKKNLYINGQKFYDYYKPRPNFSGKFTNYYVLGELAYRNKKYKSLSVGLQDEAEKKARPERDLKKEWRDGLFLRVVSMKHLSGIDKAKIMGVATKTWKSYVTDHNNKLKENQNES